MSGKLAPRLTGQREPGTTLGMLDHKTRAALALLAAMLIWGTGAVFVRSTTVALGPMDALALRYTIMVAMLAPIILSNGGWRIAKADWPRLLVVSLVGMAGYNWFVNQGFSRVPAGIGAVITMVEPMLIALLAWVLLREKLTRSLFAGLAISLCGALLLFWPDLTQDVAKPVDPVGIAALFFACLAWAIYTTVGKPLFAKYGALNVTMMTFFLSAPLFLPMGSKPLPQAFAELSPRLWAEILFLTIPNGFLATLMWNYATRHLSGALVGSFLYLVPVIAVSLGALLLGEQITVWLIAGGALILTGVAFAQYGPQLLTQKTADAR